MKVTSAQFVVTLVLWRSSCADHRFGALATPTTRVRHQGARQGAQLTAARRHLITTAIIILLLQRHMPLALRARFGLRYGHRQLTMRYRFKASRLPRGGFLDVI